jgi:hypothetical protein
MTPLEESDVPSLALSLGVSPRMARLLVEMYNRTILTYPEIYEMGYSQAHRVLVGRMRRLLKGTGIDVETKHGTGYWIDSASRTVILNTLQQARSATPEGN